VVSLVRMERYGVIMEFCRCILGVFVDYWGDFSEIVSHCFSTLFKNGGVLFPYTVYKKILYNNI